MRPRSLPPGGYPATAHGVRSAVQAMLGPSPPRGKAVAGVAPHAEWEFSGALAGAVFAGLAEDLDTIVIIGGHLAPADGILGAFEQEYETPLGNVSADLELLEAIRTRASVAEDRRADNTVEVQLPLVRHFFPGARCLGMRAPPSPRWRSPGRSERLAANCSRTARAGTWSSASHPWGMPLSGT